jgi:DNA/RNA endonuclease YhcR with UshA esterase domain
MSGTHETQKFEIIVSDSGMGGASSIEMSEVFPSPSGSDQAEFFELYNSGIDPVDISGWKVVLKNNDYFSFPSSTIIFPGEYRVFFKAATNLNLTSSNETVELKDSLGNTVQKMSYAKSVSGKSLGENSAGEMVWSSPSPWTSPGTEENIPKSKSKATKSVTKKSSTTQKTIKKTTTAKFLDDLSLVQEMEKGNVVTVEGVVSAVPGVFGSQYFYLSDENGGVQIYQSKKDFPALKSGMWLRVSGKISTLKNGSNRINIQNREGIKILNNGEEILPEGVVVSDLEKEDVGKLVSVEGEITEKKTNVMYLDDGHDEIMVYFKKGAKIKTTDLKEGSRVKVVGVVEQGKSGLEIWPRSINDIEMLEKVAEDKKSSSSGVVENNQHNYWGRYVVVTFVGTFGVLLLFIIKNKGEQVAAFLKSLLKKDLKD